MSVSLTPRIGAFGVFLLAALFAFTGCSSPPSNDDRNSRYTLTAFGNSGWILSHWVSTDGTTQSAATPRSLNIGYSGSITGNAGINSYNSTVHVSSGSLVWSKAATTRMAGSEDAMKQEALFLSDLLATKRITVRGGKLLLSGENSLQLEFTRVR
jgi:heat shock protein HslJ